MNSIIFNEENIIEKYAEGIESNLYLYQHGSKIELLKLIKDEIDLNNDKLGIPGYRKIESKITIPDEVFENKEKKVRLIKDIDELKDEVKINDIYYNKKGKFIGYTMDIEENYKILNNLARRKDKIKVLREIKEKMIKLNNAKIYIGDFNERNFLISENGVKLCDLDNYKIDNLDFDFLSHHQRTFRSNNGSEKLIDNYCYNMLTIANLGRILQAYTVQYLHADGLPYPLNTKENNEYLNDLLRGNRNYRENYLIDNLQKPYSKIKKNQ